MRSLCSFMLALLIFQFVGKSSTAKLPNIILIIADDLGYGDFYHTGHPTQEKNEIDEMAEDGLRFTHFLAAGRLCTPNRAAMLTSRYPARFGFYGDSNVLLPWASTGLPKSEVTIAEALKDIGYKTGFMGKWHLGINAFNSSDGSHLPMHHGFDYAGLTIPLGHNPLCVSEENSIKKSRFCSLYSGTEIVEQPYNTSTLSERLLDDAKGFITKNRRKPFFLYLSLPQPHDTSYRGIRFKGKSKRGLVGDTINELAWQVGEVINQVSKLNMKKRTLILFVNDHGPGIFGCQPGFSTGPFRGNGGSSWEGGIRGIALAKWFGKIKPGSVTDSITSSMDIFPTLLQVAGEKDYLKQRNITYDGKPIWDIVSKVPPMYQGKPVDDRFLVTYCGPFVAAARLNQYKLHYRTKNTTIQNDLQKSENEFCTNILAVTAIQSCNDSSITIRDPPLLYNVDEDPGESFPLDVTKHTSIVQEIESRLAKHKSSFNIPSPGAFSEQFSSDVSLSPCCNPPSCLCTS